MDDRRLVANSSRGVIVHEFHISGRNRSPTRNSHVHRDSPVSEASVLQAGSKLVREAIGEDEWKNTRLVDYKFVLNPSACFIWAHKSPQLENLVGGRSQIKSWGEKVTDEEIFRLNDLEEFQHTVQSNQSIHTTVVKRRHEVANGVDVLPPSKKRRLFTGSLHGVISQPLFHSSTFKTTTRGQKASFPDYRKSQSIAIPPYNEGQPCRPLSSYARTAWIIPIRGILPWSACTPAVVLEDDEDSLGKEGNRIQWTKTALQSFWTFLLSARAGGQLGQVGISFHVANSREREASMSTDVIINEQYSGSGPGRGKNELQVWNIPLSCADYVKVYHEANNAMALRNVLDAWAYRSPSGRKVRVLMGSKLALVDERSKGISFS
ncbi:hypothetical protein M378DRAFT_10363 [Amanita muscaria Koide BX008]|uniref:Uncharacterized protein n=1 Tax=Amanita muscaria (strain Koide BX008) TaxID=946122 RepID=A0A0C2SS00_AMAMK|nr:hypothetical protein M378DRAFT_10363 [Amanita muscaria Koide BX008]